MNSLSRSLILTTAISLALVAVAGTTPSTAQAYDTESTSAINIADDAVILKGYDAVAYFTTGKPTAGSAKFTAEHGGATYQFASAANLEAFQANPANYVPQYGGFCAMGAALGKKLDVDPTQFKIVEGKLYLNVNADVFKKWSEDVPGNIAAAELNWPLIKDKTPGSL
jgi:YHS domain-containing protein